MPKEQPALYFKYILEIYFISRLLDNYTEWFHLLCITASRCEIQFVFSSEDEIFGSYLKDRWWLQGCSYCKQCKLRGQSSPILPFLVLSMEKLQSSLKIHSLKMRKKVIAISCRYLKARYFCCDVKHIFFIFLKFHHIQALQNGRYIHSCKKL